MKIEKK